MQKHGVHKLLFGKKHRLGQIRWYLPDSHLDFGPTILRLKCALISTILLKIHGKSQTVWLITKGANRTIHNYNFIRPYMHFFFSLQKQIFGIQANHTTWWWIVSVTIESITKVCFHLSIHPLTIFESSKYKQIILYKAKVKCMFWAACNTYYTMITNEVSLCFIQGKCCL